MTELLFFGWATAAIWMAALWAWHLRLRNVAVVDVGWASGVVFVALLDAAAGSGFAPRRWLIAALMTVWGLRLSIHLLRDRVLGRAEDPRYVELRRRHSPVTAAAFFPFFQAQALLAVLFSLPALVAAVNPRPQFSGLELAAVVVWAIALCGEVAADRQLARFKARPDTRGRTCREGLWRYSRHPNYFFEWLIWMALALFALASPWGAVALVCPAVMLYLLFRVTGIPATEAQAIRTRSDDYRRYQATTSVFVPWFPRSVA